MSNPSAPPSASVMSSSARFKNSASHGSLSAHELVRTSTALPAVIWTISRAIGSSASGTKTRHPSPDFATGPLSPHVRKHREVAVRPDRSERFLDPGEPGDLGKGR